MDSSGRRTQVILGSLQKFIAYLLNRLKIPNTKTIANIMRVFVKTGPGFDTCKDRIDVEVDLIENGELQSEAFSPSWLICG